MASQDGRMELLGYKQHRTNGFVYPDIPVTDQDIVQCETVNDPFTIRLVQCMYILSLDPQLASWLLDTY